MAYLNTEMGTLEVPGDMLVDYCRGIAQEVYGEWGVDPRKHEALFDEFRYVVLEPELLSAMEESLDRTLREFPRDASAYPDYDPRG